MYEAQSTWNPNMPLRGLSSAETAEVLGLEEEKVCQVMELLRQHPDETDEQIAEKYLGWWTEA